MPDNGISSLYPQPVSPGAAVPSLLQNPGQAVGIVNNLLQLQQRQQELNARNAIGSAVQGAIGPDGTIDVPAAMTAIKNNPNAADGAPDAVSQLFTQRGQMIANGTAQFEQSAKQNRFVLDAIGSLADNPNLNVNDVRNSVVTAARNTNIPTPILAGWLNGLPQDPKKLRQYMVTLRNMAQGSSELSTPTGMGTTDTGAPIVGSRGQFNYGAASGNPQGGIVAAPPPGFAERQTGFAQMDTGLAKQLSDAAEGSQGRRALLGNLEDTLSQFTSGPGADWTKVAKAFINRNVPLPQGWQFDPKSIASQEEFSKQAAQLAQQRAIGGTGTDAKFASAFETNPNDTLSQLGNKGIIRLLKGNEDAIQTKNAAWLNASRLNPNLSYRMFSQYFNSQFDPRVFQFKYMSKAERNEYVGKMDQNDFQRLMTDIGAARRQGWVNY
jgi:hypothetical protein